MLYAGPDLVEVAGSVALVLSVVALDANDRMAAELFEQGHILLRVDQLGAGDVVDPPLAAVPCEGGSSCGGTVSPRDEGVRAATRVCRPSAVANVFGRYPRAQLCVERVAEDRPCDTSSAEVLLAVQVHPCRRKGIVLHRIWDRGVDDVLHA